MSIFSSNNNVLYIVISKRKNLKENPKQVLNNRFYQNKMYQEKSVQTIQIRKPLSLLQYYLKY